MSSDSPPIRPINLNGTRVSPVAPAVMVRVVTLPESLQNNAALLKLEGQIDSRSDQGSTLVKTPQGMIEIILKDQQAYPQGSYLTLELPAGRPPHLATILSHTLTVPLATQAAIEGETASGGASALSPSSLPAAQIALGRQGVLEPHMLESFLLYNLGNQRGSAGITGASAAQASPASSMFTLLPLSSQIAQTIQGPLNVSTASGLLSALLNAVQNNNGESRSSQAAPQSIFQIAGSFLNQIGAGNTQVPPNLSNANITAESLIGQLRTLLNSAAFQGSGASLPPESSGANNPAFQSLNAQILASLSAQNAGSANHFFSNTGATSPIALATLAGLTHDQKPILAVLAGDLFSADAQPGARSAITYYVVTGGGSDHNLTNFLRSDPSQLLFLGLGGLGAASQPSNLAVEFGSGWDTFNQILGLIEGDTTGSQSLAAASHSPQNMLLNMMPSPARPHDFSALTLFFWAITGAGDVDQFLPVAMLNTLKQSPRGKALLDQLTLDISHFARMDQAMLPPDWKGMIIPFAWQNQILKVPLYYKDSQEFEDENDTQSKRKRQLRFLFDLKLSRMGGVQVDGFLQSQRLDLILRTKTPLSPPMQREMRKLYAGAVEKSNLTGELSFQFKPEQWVDFPSSQPQPDHVGVSV